MFAASDFPAENPRTQTRNYSYTKTLCSSKIQKTLKMKSKLFLILLFPILIFGCSKLKAENDLDNENLKGKVKSIKYTAYKASEKFGEIEKGEIISFFKNEETFYNKAGFITEKVKFNEDFTVRATKKISYNEKYKPTEENYYDNNNQLLGKTKYQYVDTLINQENTYNSNGKLIRKIKYQYDKNNNAIKEETTDSTGNQSKLFLYEYDQNKNLLETKSYSEGKLLSSVKFIYDKKGRKIEFYRKNHFYNNEEEKETYKYDEKGNLLQQDNYTNNSLLSSIFYSYDENNNLINEKRTCFEIGVAWCPSYEKQYSYDKNNNLIEEKSENNKEEYIYDDNGNWTQRINMTDNIPHLIERIITYY